MRRLTAALVWLAAGGTAGAATPLPPEPPIGRPRSEPVLPSPNPRQAEPSPAEAPAAAPAPPTDASAGRGGPADPEPPLPPDAKPPAAPSGAAPVDDLAGARTPSTDAPEPPAPKPAGEPPAPKPAGEPPGAPPAADAPAPATAAEATGRPVEDDLAGERLPAEGPPDPPAAKPPGPDAAAPPAALDDLAGDRPRSEGPPEPPDAKLPQSAPTADEATLPAPHAAVGPEEAAACEADLSRRGVTFSRAAPIADGSCTAERPLEVSAVGDVALSPAATLRCPAALATSRWLEEVVIPSAALHLDAAVTGIDVAASYHCRTRRTGSPTTTLSEHAYANAIDVSAVRLSESGRVAIEARLGSSAPERAFQAAIRGGACAFFTTVIGPTTDPLHEDHLHLDLAERRNGGKLCE